MTADRGRLLVTTSVVSAAAVGVWLVINPGAHTTGGTAQGAVDVRAHAPASSPLLQQTVQPLASTDEPATAPTTSPPATPLRTRRLTPTPDRHPTKEVGTQAPQTRRGSPTTTTPLLRQSLPTVRLDRHRLSRDLPLPPPPQASIQPILDLGFSRSGTLELRCIIGTCGITFATADTSALHIYGETVVVDEPLPMPSCSPSPRVHSGTVAISWTGTNRGDGITSSGTSAGHGMLTTTVTWTTMGDDESHLAGEPTGAASWSECRKATVHP